jgi:hypothetical protein
MPDFRSVCARNWPSGCFRKKMTFTVRRGLADCSSRPRSSPRQTPSLLLERVTPRSVPIPSVPTSHGRTYPIRGNLRADRCSFVASHSESHNTLTLTTRNTANNTQLSAQEPTSKTRPLDGRPPRLKQFNNRFSSAPSQKYSVAFTSKLSARSISYCFNNLLASKFQKLQTLAHPFQKPGQMSFHFKSGKGTRNYEGPSKEKTGLLRC